MAYIKKSAREEFEMIKKDIDHGYLYFKKNYQTYHNFMRFVFKSSITPQDASVNQELQIPNVEFNIMEAFVSRQCGEFAKMDPGFNVRAKEGVQLVDPRVIEVVEAHLKAVFLDGDTNSLSYHIYRAMISGGYDVAKIYTDYASEMSFDQKIYVERVFDPTLTVFDPLARKSHKGDGRYCCELFPKSAGEIEEMFGEDALKDVKFLPNASIGELQWAYRNQEEDICMVGEFYRKKMKKAKILKLTNGHSVTEKEYESFLQKWESEGILEQPPQPMKSRVTEIETIDKFTILSNKIVDHVETNFRMLPLVFFDGNSVNIKENYGAQTEQVIRPYVYHAYNTQKMKNYAGQQLCNQLENIVQHKWIAPIEGIPADSNYQLSYTNPQKASVVLYNQFKDGNPGVPLNPPREVSPVPIPPEIMQTFELADKTIQMILGSYDAALGVNDNQLSGRAIMQGAMHSNAAAMPYLMGFLEGWARCAEIYLDLLPKYYVTPRTIPVLLPNGKREFYEINKNKGIKFDYDVSALEVTVKPGVNYEVQKQIAMQTLEHLMQVSESFKAFMEANGLEVILDNIDIRGIDKLRVMAQKWMEQQKQAQQEQAAQAQNQITPEQVAQAQIQVDMEKVQADKEDSERKAQVEMAKISANDAVKNKEADIKFLEVMSKVQNANLDRALDQERVDAENARTAIESATMVSKHINEIGEIQNGKENEEESKENE